MLSTSQKIKHLYWRSGFGLSPDEWKVAQGQHLKQSLSQLFKQAASAQKITAEIQDKTQKEFKALDKEMRKQLLKREKDLIMQQNADWIQRMANPSESAFLEKMCFFWHGHFACVTKGSKLAFAQLSTIREHALGNFRAFVKAIARDVSMIRFLNNQQNKKQQPNENFARELMELFTIGRGNYSEQDIKESARAFTGWSSDFKNEFKFKSRHHDFDSKTFMGKTGNFDGDDIIDIILDRSEAAEFITRKIYRFFVNENIDEYRVKKLAHQFHASDYDIKDLMKTIFSSDWFYDSENVGTKIKSPVELIAGIMRSLDVKFENATPVLFVERALGQILFKPPNVAGWVSGKNWIDNSTLMFRLNLAGYLFQSVDVNLRVKEEFEAKKRNKIKKKIKADINLDILVRQYVKKDKQQIFEQLSEYLLQAPTQLDLESLNPFVIRSNQSDFIKSLTMRLMSLPEYQMC